MTQLWLHDIMSVSTALLAVCSLVRIMVAVTKGLLGACTLQHCLIARFLF